MVEPTEFHSTAIVQGLLDRIRDGETDQIQTLLSVSLERLTLLARKIGQNIPGVKQFEETDDILQNSLVRLWRAFERQRPETPLDYYRLAAAIMRRELIDLSRHYFGPRGLATNQVAQPHTTNETMPDSPLAQVGDETTEPAKLSRWTEFHQYVETLPEDERLMFDLLWYQGLTLEEAAGLMHSSERTIRRRWKALRIALHEQLLDDRQL